MFFIFSTHCLSHPSNRYTNLQLIETQLATYRPAESSIDNQSGSDQDSLREQPLASSRSEPSQSPIESQQTDRLRWTPNLGQLFRGD